MAGEPRSRTCRATALPRANVQRAHLRVDGGVIGQDATCNDLDFRCSQLTSLLVHSHVQIAHGIVSFAQVRGSSGPAPLRSEDAGRWLTSPSLRVAGSARRAERVSDRLVGLLLLWDALGGLPGHRLLRLRARARLPRTTAQGTGTRHSPILLRGDLRRTRPAAPRTLTSACHAVCLTVKPVGEPDAGDRHVRFDERGWETGRCRMAQAAAPILDSTFRDITR